jgi:hypothetical protein
MALRGWLTRLLVVVYRPAGVPFGPYLAQNVQANLDALLATGQRNADLGSNRLAS